MKLYLVRHTRTVLRTAYCYGQADVKLATSFDKEFLQLQAHLPKQIDAIYTSPLIRCKLLAEEIVKGTNVGLVEDPRLKEMNFGSWEQKKWSDINTQELTDWMNNFVEVKVPQGESFSELNMRVIDFIKNVILSESAHDTVIIITHGGVIRCFLNFILEFSLRNAFKLKIDLGSVSLVELTPEATNDKVIFFNKN